MDCMNAEIDRRALVEFIQTNLTRDEALARTASDGPWTSRAIGGDAPYVEITGSAGRFVAGLPVDPDVEGQAAADAAYLVDLEPTRQLARIRAQWEILKSILGPQMRPADQPEGNRQIELLLAMAQQWSHRPGWQSAWLRDYGP